MSTSFTCLLTAPAEESDEEGCDEAGLLSTVVETQQPGPSGLSLLALTVAIDRGRMSMLTAVEVCMCMHACMCVHYRYLSILLLVSVS